jgi:hypothetical protein
VTWRNGHGTGAGQPRIEVMPPDELPVGVAAPLPSSAAVVERDAAGRVTGSAAAAALGRIGGNAKAGQSRLAHRIALGESFADERFQPFARSARAFRRLHVSQLARTVGGGVCGPAPASIIASAALQLAASRFAFEVLGDMALGSRLANDSRQNLLAAHELCAREAEAHKSRHPEDAHRAVFETFGTAPARPVLGTTRESSESGDAGKAPSRASNGHAPSDENRGAS